MSSFAFGMILIGAGVVAYLAKARSEAGRMGRRRKSHEPACLEIPGHGFARISTDRNQESEVLDPRESARIRGAFLLL